MARFPYHRADVQGISYMPRFPITLSRGSQSINLLGLLDTGAAVNVLPYEIGVTLGAVWEAQTVTMPLVGSLGQHEAKALFLMAENPDVTHGQQVKLAFAWVRETSVPLILGQMNFFMEFDVCFYRSRQIFDVHLKQDR